MRRMKSILLPFVNRNIATRLESGGTLLNMPQPIVRFRSEANQSGNYSLIWWIP
jgi:hypothetical protein